MKYTKPANIQVSDYYDKTYKRYGNEITRLFLGELYKWDESASFDCFYTSDVLDMMLSQAKERFNQGT